MTEPKITITGKKMTIEVDLDTEGEPSKSGKSKVISSTHGNKHVGDYMVGINIYQKVGE
jgi:hypothetical protein